MAKKKNQDIFDMLFSNEKLIRELGVQRARDMAPRQEVTLYAPEKKKWDAMANELDFGNSLTILNAHLDPLLKSVRYADITEITETGDATKHGFMALFVKQKRVLKADVCRALAYFLLDSRNALPLISQLKPHEVELTRLLFRDIYVSVQTLQTLMPDVVWYHESRFNWDHDLSSAIELPWVGFENANYWHHTKEAPQSYHYYYLSAQLLSFYYAALCPEAKETPEGIDQLPEGLTVFNGESQMVASYGILQSQFAQGALDIDTNLKLKVGDFRRAQQLTGLKHFHPDDLPKEQAAANALNLALPVLACALNVDSDASIHQLMRKIVSDVIGSWYQANTFYQRLLPYVSGFKKNVLFDHDNRRIGFRLFELLSACGTKWVSFDQLCLSLQVYRSGYSYQFGIFSPRELDLSPLQNSMTGRIIGCERVAHEITMGQVRGLCCMLSGLGLLEVAYRPFNADGTDVTPYDFMQYVRLTPLGRYAFHIDQKYKAPEQEKRQYFVLEEEHLILRSLVADNPYVPLLSDTAEYIGAQRYRMSPESFLAGCTNETDVQHRIQQFRQFICPEPPRIWEEFFAEISRHVHPLTVCKSSEYYIYTIDPQNRRLIELLTSDLELRRLIIRAEGFLILIKSQNYGKFVDRLKSFGYLL